MPKDLQNIANWRNFAKPGHTGHYPPTYVSVNERGKDILLNNSRDFRELPKVDERWKRIFAEDRLKIVDSDLKEVKADLKARSDCSDSAVTSNYFDPKHTIYAFSICIIEIVIRKGRKLDHF